MSTVAVDTWQAVNIWTENVTEVSNGFLPLTHVPPMNQMKNQVPPIKEMKNQILNLKKPKTQVPIEYLTLFLFRVYF